VTAFSASEKGLGLNVDVRNPPVQDGQAGPHREILATGASRPKAAACPPSERLTDGARYPLEKEEFRGIQKGSLKIAFERNAGKWSFLKTVEF
jgi:hypothetical protein